MAARVRRAESRDLERGMGIEPKPRKLIFPCRSTRYDWRTRLRMNGCDLGVCRVPGVSDRPILLKSSVLRLTRFLRAMSAQDWGCDYTPR